MPSTLGAQVPVSSSDNHEDAYTSPDRSLTESDPGPLHRGWSGGPALSHSEFSGGEGDRVGEKARARDRNRDAQRRFRQRQREQAASSMRMVADMTARLEAMALRQSELELRNQVLEHTVRLSHRHAQQLSLPQTGVGGPELDRKQQQLLMLESTHVWSRVMGKALSDYTLQYCCNMPFGTFMDEEFPALIHRLGSLLEAGGWDPDSPAGRELCTIVTLRHKEEYRNALFSRWFVALTAWNEEIMRDPAVSPPASSFWANILEGLRLEPGQVAVLANARHTLLRRIIDIRNARAKIVLALGTAAVQPEADLRKHDGVKRLHQSLEDEREAVLDFLYKAIDDCLTPAQEAYLDCSSCPWWPDLWHMTGLLAAQKMPLLAAGSRKPPQEKDVPAATAPPQHAMFEMLRRPQLALGQGLILKRGLASVPIAEEALWQVPPLMPSIALLRGMTSLDIMCGVFWDASTRARYPLPKRTSKLNEKAADAAVRALNRRSVGSNSFVEP
ncbi:hypothetical protein WJX73_010797 [Symbiochloris irregularis]|uniref:BZIP domain-containing protein n=1 Tax=Symbiochloris irregularis TaxID=706552 RepID=A0AAW1P2H3_9CHLO